MKCFSLFSGIGGFDIACQRKGLELVGACEIDKHARQVYSKHFPSVRIWEDATIIRPEELPDFDILCAGFPCQAFSVAGKRLGFEESRGTLFYEIARIAKQKRPRYLLLENVTGLLNHDEGRTFTEILSSLDEIGYDAEWQVINSKYFVPQNRERVFIIGHLRGQPWREIFPLGEYDQEAYRTNEVTGNIAVVRDHDKLRHTGDLANCIDSNYWKGCDNHGQRTMIKTDNRELKQIGNVDTKGHNSIWGRVYDAKGIAPTINALGGGLGAKTGLIAIPVLTPDRLEKKQNGRRFKTDGEPAFTLTAQDRQGVFDGVRIRRLTPLECEILQGFPPKWTDIGLADTQRYRCIGNAITVPVVEYILDHIQKGTVTL